MTLSQGLDGQDSSLEGPALVEACPNEGFTAQLKAFDEELRIGVLGAVFRANGLSRWKLVNGLLRHCHCCIYLLGCPVGS